MGKWAGKAFSRFARFADSNGTSFAFLVALLAATIVYRIALTIDLTTRPIRPFEFSPPGHPIRFILEYAHLDAALVLACFLITLAVSQARHFLRGGPLLVIRAAGMVVAHGVLLALVFFHLGHLRILFDVQTGLDYSIMYETVFTVSSRDIAKFLEARDYVFMAVPFVAWWLFLFSRRTARAWMAAAATFLIVGAFVAPVFIPSTEEKTPAEIRANPILFLAKDTLQSTLFRRAERKAPVAVVSGREAALHPNLPEYSVPLRITKTTPDPGDRKWNIVFIVLESVGARYVSDAEKGQPAPMPFFRDLAERAWDLQRHYTTSNVSTKAVFSIFSGLYDLFNRDALGTRRDAMVPSISNFLPREYDSFLVTPASSSWYFPVQFMKNSGLPEMHTYENLPFQVREETVSLGRYIARDEIQTVDFFLKRVDKAREPFLGIYISFAAHFPYFDYGPDYRVRGDDGRMISRYYNNLKLLDAMIRRIFEHLQGSGKLERTILVIAGDHGQAFGQHQPDNYLHYRYLYNENLEVPVILYQPRLFPARKITVPTSHVDLLPTILDAVKVPYDPSLLDGESLFQNKLGRRYLFFYGLDESVASLDDQGIKVHSSRKKNVCRVYDLKQDPGETHPLDCSSYSRQAEALRAFIAYHDTRLLEYNAEIGAGKDFRGRRHPTVWIAERKRAESPPPSPPPARGRAGVVGNESNAELGIGNAESKSSAPNAESEPRSKVGSTDAPGEGEKAVRRNVVRSSEPDEKLGGNDSINSR